MTVASPAAPPKLGFATRFFYGFGSIAYGVKDIAFRTYLLWYYNYIIGAPPALVSAAIMVALIFDAISDPVVGQISDQLRTRWGRRHPLMYASAIPASLSFILLWFPPPGLEGGALFVYLVVLATAVRTFITLYEIPSSALAPELAPGYDERTAIASYRYFFGYLGGIGLSFITLFYFMRPTEAYPVGQLNPEAYLAFGLFGGALMFCSVVASTVGTHHRIKYLRLQPNRSERRNPFQTIALMARTFSNRNFLAILSFGILKYSAIGLTSALALYFGTFFWGFNNTQLALLTLEYIVAASLALAFAPWASRLMGKRNAAFVLAVLAVVMGALPFILRLNGLFFENDDPRLLPAVFAIGAVYSLCGVSSAILVHAMIGDVIDDSSLRTGRRAEGLFYAANSFMQKSVSGIGVFAAGLLLSLVGFPEKARPGQVPQDVINALAIWYIPILMALYIGGACFLYFYRLRREDHDANLEAIRQQETEAAGE
jgi:Na+/melibiose symporter-like transporter